MVSATKPAPELSVLREPLREIGGEQVLAGLTSSLSWLEANQQEINDLNVFPVPDGDTGSNMYLTAIFVVMVLDRVIHSPARFQRHHRR